MDKSLMDVTPVKAKLFYCLMEYLSIFQKRKMSTPSKFPEPSMPHLIHREAKAVLACLFMFIGVILNWGNYIHVFGLHSISVGILRLLEFSLLEFKENLLTMSMGELLHEFLFPQGIPVIFFLSVYGTLFMFELPNMSTFVTSILPFTVVMRWLYMAGYDHGVLKRTIWLYDSGLSMGNSLAYSFFYGYLNITLPDRGDQNFGLKEMIQRYEANENITIPAKKIFIVVPSSLYCPPSLGDLSKHKDLFMEPAKTMLTIYRSVAGNLKRPYRHSVYKLIRSDKSLPVHVVVEGASPLDTYYKICAYGVPNNDTFEFYKDDVLSMFYYRMKYIIDNDYEFKDLCEFVYFDNVRYPKLNIAKVVLDRVEETVRQEKKYVTFS